MTHLDHPNIILLILDSARKDMFGCYGSSLGLTPNIDALAENSILLRDFYAAACGSAPAHVSIFSGQHSARHGMVHNLCEMPQDLLTLPLLLKQFGYKCYGFSKASFIPPAGHEELFGFDELIYPGRKGFSGQESPLNRFFAAVRSHPFLFNRLKQIYGRIIGKQKRFELTASYFDGRSSLNYLSDCLVQHKNREPVFAYATLLHPHTPYFPPKPFRDRVFKGASLDPLSIDIQQNLHAFMNGDFGEVPEALESVRKCYQADLLYGDHLVGEFVHHLKEKGVFDNSILIVTSDHGELLGEHGVMNHGSTVWEELLAIPCIVHSPNGGGAKEISRLTSSLDLLPTVFDIIGELEWLRNKTKLDGVSILSPPEGHQERVLVVDSPPAVLPERFKRYPMVLFEESKIARAARTSRYKYIWRSDGTQFLFRAGGGEDQRDNLISSAPEVASDLLKEIRSFYESVQPNFRMDLYPVRLSRSVGQKMTDPAVLLELKRLGYL